MRPPVLRAYQTLQVAPWASRDELKQAYHERAKQHHPDVQGMNILQTETMVRLNRAFEVLSLRG